MTGVDSIHDVNLDFRPLTYSWIERPCQNRYTHFLSGCRKARTNPRPATVVSERAASSPACTHLRNSKIHKVLPPMINMISPPAQKCTSGFVSGSIVPFQRTYARPKASCFGEYVTFFRRHFLQGSRCAGQHGTHREIHRESKHPSQLSKKKLDEKSDKCRPHNQLILPG